MKAPQVIQPGIPRPAGRGMVLRVGGGQRSRRGSALLVVFTLLTLMAALTMANQKTLIHLKRELRLIEHRQLRQYQPPSLVATNPPPREAAAESTPAAPAVDTNSAASPRTP